MVLGLLVLALHLATLTRYPQVWLDEVIFTDPAVNLAWTGRFTSTAWYFQSADAYWAANVPLYSWLLAAWIEVGGLSPLAVRSLNLVLAALSSALLVAWPWRMGWLRSSRWTLLYAALVMAGHGMVVAARSGRYDVLGLLLCALLLWTLLLPGALWRRGLAMVIAAGVVPMAGLHVALYVGLLAVFWLAWCGLRPWREVLLILGGLALGGLALLLVYRGQGVLADFLLNVRLSGYGGKKDWPKDPSLWLLVLAALGLAWRHGPGELQRRHPVALGLVVAGLGVPAVIFLVARLPTFYAWMVHVPLALGLVMWGERAERLACHGVDDAPASPITRPLQRLLWLAVLVGLPLQTTLGTLLWVARDPVPLNHFLAASGAANQVVLVDPAAYYAVKPVARQTYLTMYNFDTDAQPRLSRKQVRLMIVDPITQPALARQMGGTWLPGPRYEPAPGPWAPAQWEWLARRVSHSLFGNYRLQVFQREPEPEAGPAGASSQ